MIVGRNARVAVLSNLTLTAGPYQVVVFAFSQDVATPGALTGPFNISAASVPLMVDNTPPTASITSPAANANVRGMVPVSASASDDVGVAGVQFLLDTAFDFAIDQLA